MFRLTAAFMLVSSSALAGNVVVIDPLGGPGASLLQSAISSAVDGDILLLKSGNYHQTQPFAISGKGITIANDSGGTLEVERLAVDLVPSGKVLVLRGLTAKGQLTPAAEAALALANCAGTVWVEECRFTGGDGLTRGGSFVPEPGGPAIRMSNCASVVIERTITIGGHGFTDPSGALSDGGPSVDVMTSTVTIHGSDFSGGASASAPFGAADGGPAMLLESGDVFAAGTVFEGGVLAITVFVIGHSGDGLDVISGSVRARDCVFDAGFSIVPGNDGQPIVAPPGAVTTFPDVARSLAVSGPARDGVNVTVIVTGQPGDVAAIFLGFPGPPIVVPPLQGSFLLPGGPLAGPFVLGTIPGFGTITSNFLAPALPAAGPDGITVGVQAAILTPSGTLEAGSMYVQVKAGF